MQNLHEKSYLFKSGHILDSLLTYTITDDPVFLDKSVKSYDPYLIGSENYVVFSARATDKLIDNEISGKFVDLIKIPKIYNSINYWNSIIKKLFKYEYKDLYVDIDKDCDWIRIAAYHSNIIFSIILNSSAIQYLKLESGIPHTSEKSFKVDISDILYANKSFYNYVSEILEDLGHPKSYTPIVKLWRGIIGKLLIEEVV